MFDPDDVIDDEDDTVASWLDGAADRESEPTAEEGLRARLFQFLLEEVQASAPHDAQIPVQPVPSAPLRALHGVCHRSRPRTARCATRSYVSCAPP